MLFTYFNSRVVQTKRNVLETRGWQRDGGRVGADLDAARLLGRAEADRVPVGEENPVDGGVDLGSDLGPMVAGLAALQHELLLLRVVRVQLLRLGRRGRRGRGRRIGNSLARPPHVAAVVVNGRLVGARLVAEHRGLAAWVLPERLVRILELDGGELGVLK